MLVRIAVVVLLIPVLPSGFTRAAERTPRSVLPVAGIDALTTEIVRGIDAVGRSDLEAAAARFGALAFPGSNPEADRAAIIRLLKPFGALPAEFDSVDFVAAVPLSSRAYELVYVAHGRRAPVMFRFRVYQSEGWRVLNIGFDSNWDAIREGTREGRFDEPVTIPTRTLQANRGRVSVPVDSK